MKSEDEKFYNSNVEFINDLFDYYCEMEKELTVLLDEAFSTNRDMAKLYIFGIPLISQVSGMAIGTNKNKYNLFQSEELKVIFGKEYYKNNCHHWQNLIEPIDEDYMRIYEDYGASLPKFPYVQRCGSNSYNSCIDEVYEKLNVLLRTIDIDLSSQILFSESIQFGEMLVILAVDFSDSRYLRYKEEIDVAEKESICYKYFLDTVLHNFLEKWCEHIYYGLSYTTIDFLANTQAILRGSANDILQDRHLPSVEVITRLANTEYEGRYACGTIRFHENHEDLLEGHTILLSKPISFEIDNIKELRKFIEVSREHICIEATMAYPEVLGFGEMGNDDDSYIIKFVGKNAWEFYKGNVKILKYEKGRYKVPVEVSREYILEKLEKKFRGGFDEVIADILLAACEQKHGTIVVVSSDAEKDMESIVDDGKGKRIQKADLSKTNKEMITCLCAVDGALMIDPYGICEGMGLILPNDGNNKGDPSRGARYNSAKAYSSKHKKDLVCVISEDGMIDFM